jgi:conjugal transfer pilus assembly protein TraB
MLREKLELLHASLPEYVKTKQKLFFFGGFGLITFLIIVFIAVKSSANSKERQRKENEALPVEKRIKIDSGGSSLNPQEIWVDRLEKQQALLNKRFELIEKLVVDLTKGRIAPAHPMGFTPNERADPSLSEDQTPLNSGTSFNRLDPSGVMKTAEMGNFAAHRPSSSGYDLDPSSSQNAPLPTKMQRITFSLDPLASKKIKKSIDHYVPAGSFVRGNLTSGVIASTAVQASSNPQPVHIELTHLGNLPRGFKADVKQCFLIGSAYGDLSSERVLMRLETLSCVERKTQEIIEIEVDGFVTGEDGANGIRGILVDRSGPAMRNAFIGGFIGGMGGFFSQQQSMMPATILPSGAAAVSPLTAQHMLQGGAGKGVGNAMEKLSDFYIKRAEQLQPVLEVEPGRLVHVVFKKGFDMNQTVYRQSLMNTRDFERRDIADKAGTETYNDATKGF